MKNRLLPILITAFAILTVSGCAINLYKKDPRDKDRIKNLSGKVAMLQEQIELERKNFENAREELAKKLTKQIKNHDASVEVSSRGLVIRLSNNILFDSGKAQLKNSASRVLNEVSNIIISEFPNKNIGIEGHTDNVPIKYSKWKSNWELSTARATSVLHQLVKNGVNPAHLSAIGYGQYRPIASNKTAEGRRKNRRVEIVILPDLSEKDYAKEAMEMQEKSEQEPETIK